MAPKRSLTCGECRSLIEAAPSGVGFSVAVRRLTCSKRRSPIEASIGCAVTIDTTLKSICDGCRSLIEAKDTPRCGYTGDGIDLRRTRLPQDDRWRKSYK